ncbi:carbohydrate kinase [Clostridium carnis]
MNKVVSIGEALIDFIPFEKGIPLKDVTSFFRVPGGAPLNVAATVAKLGGRATMLTKLGQDGFGDHIIECVKLLGVDTSSIKRTIKANTALAFVSLKENGERDFSFYRNPSADMLLESSEIEEDIFEENGILHFCSVSLIEDPIKEAHKRAIKIAKTKKCLISFDPNVRLPLWENPEDCRKAILEFLPLANIIKISDEELKFITGIENERKAIQSLFTGEVQIIIYTKGINGAEFITKNKTVFSPSFKVVAQDTTGAGDSFIGSFLYKVIENDYTLEDLLNLKGEQIKDILTFSNSTAALTVCKKGAISALPTKEEVLELAKGR